MHEGCKSTKNNKKNFAVFNFRVSWFSKNGAKTKGPNFTLSRAFLFCRFCAVAERSIILIRSVPDWWILCHLS